MKRILIEQLKEWKNSQNRKPLIIRGARQVGKTWLMKEFGRTCFENFVYINFDNNERVKAIFKGYTEPKRIITALNAETGTAIKADKTLIIFDEIQENPDALTALKYFYENAPEYFIVAAGSLLGIALHQGSSFPVGKVDFLDLYPMNFREFLCACGDENYENVLASQDFNLITSFKSVFIERLRQYFYVGGMPEVVKSFAENQDFTEVRRLQKNLIEYYQQDFSKHAPLKEVPRLNMVWQSIPGQLAKENKKFVFGAIKKSARASEFEVAIQWLCDCGLVHKVNRTKKGDIPLIAYMVLGVFKLYLHDVGLLCAMGDIDSKTIIDGSRIFEEFKGALTEQFVLNELISECNLKPYYYSADNSTAEIDFIIQQNGKVVPVEVKAGENLQAKSLKVYHQKYQNPVSVRTSLSDFRQDEWLTNIPLYAILRIKDFV